MKTLAASPLPRQAAQQRNKATLLLGSAGLEAEGLGKRDLPCNPSLGFSSSQAHSLGLAKALASLGKKSSCAGHTLLSSINNVCKTHSSSRNSPATVALACVSQAPFFPFASSSPRSSLSWAKRKWLPQNTFSKHPHPPPQSQERKPNGEGVREKQHLHTSQGLYHHFSYEM